MPAAYVQHKVMLGGDGNGATYAMPGNITAGNHILVLFPWSYNGCPPSFTDTRSNTYTQKANGGSDPGNGALWIFTAPITTGGSCTVTLSASCGVVRVGGVIVEVSGLQSDPFDQKNVKSNSTSPVDAESITPTTDGQYILALFVRRTGVSFVSFTAGASFTEREEWGINSAAFEDYIQPTAGAISPDGTVGLIDGTTPVDGYCASFKAVADAGQPAIRRLGLFPGFRPTGIGREGGVIF